LGEHDLDKRNWGSKFEVKRLKVKVTGNENVKIVFSHIFIKSGSIYDKQGQNDPQPYTHIVQSNAFHQQKWVILCAIWLSVCLLHTSHRLPFVHSILERGRNFFLGGGSCPLH